MKMKIDDIEIEIRETETDSREFIFNRVILATHYTLLGVSRSLREGVQHILLHSSDLRPNDRKSLEELRNLYENLNHNLKEVMKALIDRANSKTDRGTSQANTD